jgi:hypothetical protein
VAVKKRTIEATLIVEEQEGAIHQLSLQIATTNNAKQQVFENYHYKKGWDVRTEAMVFRAV